MSDKPGLLPCPFCGGAAEMFGRLDKWVECGNRKACRAEGPLGNTIEQAAALWNRRASALPAGSVVVPREIIDPFLRVTKRMDGYNDGLATQVTTEVVGGRVVFALDALWVKHWRELLSAAPRKEG